MKKRWKNPNVIALGVENTYDMENYSIAPPFPSQDGKQPTRIKCGHCEKVFKSANDLGNVKHLLDVLYVCDLYKEAISVLDLLKDAKFTGNYTIWDVIVYSRAVVMRIQLELGNLEEANVILDSIQSYFNPSLYENLKVKIMNIYKKNELVAEENGWKSDIRDWKLKQLERKLYFSIIPDFPIDKVELEKEIQELKAELKTLIK